MLWCAVLCLGCSNLSSLHTRLLLFLFLFPPERTLLCRVSFSIDDGDLLVVTLRGRPRLVGGCEESPLLEFLPPSAHEVLTEAQGIHLPILHCRQQSFYQLLG